MSSTPERRSSPSGVLDASFYPHLVDTIFRSANHAALLALRGGSRDFKDRAEAEYARHLHLSRHGLQRSRGRLPCTPAHCDELVATSDPDYFTPGYLPPSLGVRHLVLSLSFEALTLNHAVLVPGRGGLDTSPEAVTVIFTPPAYECQLVQGGVCLLPVVNGCHLVRRGTEYRVLIGRVGEWVAGGLPTVLVDAQLARCCCHPCAGCVHLQAVKDDLAEAITRAGGGGEAEFISMEEYVARVGEETAKRHTQSTSSS